MKIDQAIKNKDFNPEKDFVDVDLNVYKKTLFNRFYKWLHPKKFDKVKVAEQIINHFDQIQSNWSDQGKLYDLGERMIKKHPDSKTSQQVTKIFKREFAFFEPPKDSSS